MSEVKVVSTENDPAIVKPEEKKEKTKHYYEAIDKLRFLLIMVWFFNVFGYSTPIGKIVQTMCGFVTIAFFVISGYLVLRPSEDRSEKIKREIKRTAIAFGIMAAAYFIFNLVFFKIYDFNILPMLATGRFWIDFLLFNIWPLSIGNSIWYIQAMLYAYIIIYFLDKFNLLRFDWIIVIVCLVVTVLCGELSGIVKFSFAGYSYFVGNFFTRALPYILMGGVIARKKRRFFKIKTWIYVVLSLVGIELMLAEIIVLARLDIVGYYGHLIGMSITAISLCCIAFKNYSKGFRLKFLRYFNRFDMSMFYYLAQPMSILLACIAQYLGGRFLNTITPFMVIFAYLACLAVIAIFGPVRRRVFHRYYAKKEYEKAHANDKPENSKSVG